MERAHLSTALGKERPQLTAARERMGLSLQQVARHVGVTKTTVYRWEKEGVIPQPEHLIKLRQLFGMSAAALGFPETVVEAVATDGFQYESLTIYRAEDAALRIQKIVWDWSRSDARYHILQTAIILELEDNSMEDLTRRSVIRHLALVPIDMLKLSTACAVFTFPIEIILAHCAAGIVACWHLRKGKELVRADDIVAHYIPTLEEIVKTAPAEVQRKAAADLLAQCFLLRAVLTWGISTAYDAIGYAQEAKNYSATAEKRALEIVALRVKAAAHWYAHQYKQALQAALQAKYLLDERDKHDRQKTVSSRSAEEPIPLLVYSYVYAGLATYQARDKVEKGNALLSLKKAHETFFARPPDEVVPLWVDHSIGNLLLNDGSTHALLGKHKAAVDSLSQITTKRPLDATIPFSCRIEAMIDQVTAEANRTDQLRDKTGCITLWTSAIEGAIALHSEKNFNMAIQAYAAMCAAWPTEQDVIDLREHIVHW